MRSLMVLGLLFGCAGESESPNPAGVGGKADSFAPPTWLNCTPQKIDSGTFARTDIHCDVTPPSDPLAFQMVSLELDDKSGPYTSLILVGDDHPKSDVSAWQDHLPLSTRALFLLDVPSAVDGRAFDSLRVLEAEGIIDADAALSVAQPFSVWSLALESADTVVVKFDYELALPAPVTTDQGEATVHVQHSVLVRPEQATAVVVPVPAGAPSLAATVHRQFGDAPIALEGPGRWILAGDGAHRPVDPAPTPDPIVDPSDPPADSPDLAAPPDLAPAPTCGYDGLPTCNGSCYGGTIYDNGMCRACGDDGQITCNGSCHTGTVYDNGFCRACGDNGQITCNGSCHAGTTYDNGFCRSCGDDGQIPCNGSCHAGTHYENGFCRKN